MGRDEIDASVWLEMPDLLAGAGTGAASYNLQQQTVLQTDGRVWWRGACSEAVVL